MVSRFKRPSQWVGGVRKGMQLRKSLHQNIASDRLKIELNWIEFNTFKRRRLQIDQRHHTTNELNKLINVHNNFEKFIKDD